MTWLTDTEVRALVSDLTADGHPADERADWCEGCASGSYIHAGACTGYFRTPDLADERADIIARFTAELAKVTGDGSRKRQAGTKPPWYEDDSHEGAVFSHLTKWKRGELVDPDSGCHPLVHASWRLLAIALRETGNIPDA